MRKLLMFTAAFLAATAATAGNAPSMSEQRVDKILAGKVAGEPRGCLTPQESRRSTNYDGVVLFRKSSKLVWRNDLNGCPLLRDGDILSTRLYGTSRLCRGDIAQIIDGTGRYVKGACTLGEFVPYRAPD